MTAELDQTKLCQVIETTLKSTSNTDALSESVTMESSMGSPREWDSLSFISVFFAIGEAFSVELDDDDAIHFQSVPSIHQFLAEVLTE